MADNLAIQLPFNTYQGYYLSSHIECCYSP